MNKTFINLTPHEINVHCDGLVTTFEPLKNPARVKQEMIPVYKINGIQIYKTSYGKVMDLCDEMDGVILIVSTLVKNASPDRKDLVSPGELIRNEAGQPVGCKGFCV